MPAEAPTRSQQIEERLEQFLHNYRETHDRPRAIPDQHNQQR